MNRKEELILKTTKEIIVKFIETGRIYPSSFGDNYAMVARVVRESIRDEGEEK